MLLQDGGPNHNRRRLGPLYQVGFMKGVGRSRKSDRPVQATGKRRCI
jgi:hypothetical protein